MQLAVEPFLSTEKAVALLYYKRPERANATIRTAKLEAKAGENRKNEANYWFNNGPTKENKGWERNKPIIFKITLYSIEATR